MGQIFLSHWEERRADGSRVMHRPGDDVTVGGDVLARLARIGAVGDRAHADPVTPQPTAPSETAAGTPEVSTVRPRKVDKLEAWQAYARTAGVDPKDLSKAELIARLGEG